MGLTLDTGALLALERRRQRMAKALDRLRLFFPGVTILLV
jgi:hypothetical protein